MRNLKSVTHVGYNFLCDTEVKQDVKANSQ
jgi:hypothetical protein